VLAIHLRPHFYQTRWFFAFCVLLIAAAGWGAYRLHVRNLRRQFAAVLDERNRLAREMHDTLIQGCVGVSTLLEAASHAQDVSPDLSQELLDRARAEVRAAVDEARLAVWDLRHGSRNGDRLVPAVSQLAERIGLDAGLEIGVEIVGHPVGVGGDNEHNLLLLMSVVLRFDPGRIDVTIEDDGVGFDPSVDPGGASPHYGLVGMRERVEHAGGEFHLTSAPGRGTQVRVTIPLAHA
jgi:signal transduction histidine kinase